MAGKKRRVRVVELPERDVITPNRITQNFAVIVSVLEAMFPYERDKVLTQTAFWFGYSLRELEDKP